MPLQQGDPPQIGRYRLTARLGSGGMGVVYLGQADDGQQVAVKVLRPEYADDHEFRERFRREVAAMGRVRNRYCVQVLDADTESATPFLATQFADGPSLDEQIKDNGPLHPDAVYRLGSALAEAIAAIHAAGVTHRDLKPSNVLLTNAGPMVIDFGIAQVADSVSITRTGMAVGSPGYMAPEQVTGHAGREADIFTWALIVAFAASGRPPFGMGETVAILHRILNERPDISAVPPQMLPLVQVALEKDPNRRPVAADLLRELQSPGSTQVLAAPDAFDGATRLDAPGTRLDGPMTRGFDNRTRTRTLAGGGPGPGYPGPGYPGEPGSGYYGEPRPQRRWRGPVAAAAVLVAAVVVGVVLLSNNGSPGNHSPGVSTPTATGAAQPSTVTQPSTSGNEDGNSQGAPGQAKKHKHGTGTGNGTGTGTGTGGGTGNGGTNPTTAPSSSPSTAPSQSTSPGAGTPTAQSTPTSGTGNGAAA